MPQDWQRVTVSVSDELLAGDDAVCSSLTGALDACFGRPSWSSETRSTFASTDHTVLELQLDGDGSRGFGAKSTCSYGRSDGVREEFERSRLPCYPCKRSSLPFIVDGVE